MNSMDGIFARAKAAPKRIVLAEGMDARVIEGAALASRLAIAQPVLLGDPSVIEQELIAAEADLDYVTLIDPAHSEYMESYVETYVELRQHRGIDRPKSKAAMLDPLNFATMMVRQGDADGSIGGAVATTADTVRAALQIIGPAAGVQTVSSVFLMILEEPHHQTKGLLIFSDCGLVVEPTVKELAAIACTSADTYQALTQDPARVAMLSFSTGRSAEHKRVDRVIDATDLVKILRPDILIDGDLQFDAAFVPAISKSKAPHSPLAGRANVMVFPNLDAANIGYKIAERIGGAKTIGPILQGLAKPANDLSRGCTAEDVLNAIAVTALQANMT